MELNDYYTYSAVTVNAKKDLEVGNDRVFNLIDEFKNIRSIKSAKEFIEQNWNITDNVTKFPIGNSCELSTKEDDKGYCVNFVLENENVTCFFCK